MFAAAKGSSVRGQTAKRSKIGTTKGLSLYFGCLQSDTLRLGLGLGI